MLTRVDLSRFKCFEELKLPLSSLTILSGTNASGKSSLYEIDAFRIALARVMSIRQAIIREGRSLGCHRNMLNAQVGPGFNMQQAVQRLSNDQRRALMLWLTSQGPHWEDDRQHLPDDWVEVGEDIVTESAVAEATIRNARGLLCSLVSFDPSDWLYTPVNAQWVRGGGIVEAVTIANFWALQPIEAVLESNPLPVDSWAALRERVTDACTRLTFGEDAFDALQEKCGNLMCPARPVHARGPSANIAA